MPRPPHQEWDIGFTKVVVDGKKYAKCQKCGRCLAKTSSASLRTHRDICNSSRLAKAPNSNGSETNNLRTLDETDASIHLEETSQPDSPSLPVASNNISSTCVVVRNTKVNVKNDEALLELFASLNLDFQIIESFAFKKFVSTVIPSYKLPSVEMLLSTTLSEAYKKWYGEHLQLNLAFFMGAFTQKIGENFYVISLIIKNKKYFYLDSDVIEHDESVNSKMENFIEKSIVECKEKHQAVIKYCIFDSNIIIKDHFFIENEVNGVIEKFSVYVYNSFRLTIDNLLYKIDKNFEDYEKCTSYVNKLKKKSCNDDYGLSDAVNDLFELSEIMQHNASIKAIVLEEIQYFLKPVVMLSNFLDHRFAGKKFLHNVQYEQAMLSVLYDVVPEDAIYAVSLYRENSDPFSREVFNDSAKKFDKIKYWRIMKGQKHNIEDCDLISLSNFAMKMISLPSVIKVFTESSMTRIFNSKNRNCYRTTAAVACAILNE